MAWNEPGKTITTLGVQIPGAKMTAPDFDELLRRATSQLGRLFGGGGGGGNNTSDPSSLTPLSPWLACLRCLFGLVAAFESSTNKSAPWCCAWVLI